MRFVVVCSSLAAVCLAGSSGYGVPAVPAASSASASESSYSASEKDYSSPQLSYYPPSYSGSYGPRYVPPRPVRNCNLGELSGACYGESRGHCKLPLMGYLKSYSGQPEEAEVICRGSKDHTVKMRDFMDKSMKKRGKYADRQVVLCVNNKWVRKAHRDEVFEYQGQAALGNYGSYGSYGGYGEQYGGNLVPAHGFTCEHRKIHEKKESHSHSKESGEHDRRSREHSHSDEDGDTEF